MLSPDFNCITHKAEEFANEIPSVLFAYSKLLRKIFHFTFHFDCVFPRYAFIIRVLIMKSPVTWNHRPTPSENISEVLVMLIWGYVPGTNAALILVSITSSAIMATMPPVTLLADKCSCLILDRNHANYLSVKPKKQVAVNAGAWCGQSPNLPNATLFLSFHRRLKILFGCTWFRTISADPLPC